MSKKSLNVVFFPLTDRDVISLVYLPSEVLTVTKFLKAPE